MRNTTMRHRSVLGLVLASVVVLSGCAAETPAPVLSASPTESAMPSTSPSEPAKVPDATAAPPSSSSPVGLTCEQLITLDELYAFNPNFSLVAVWSPPAGTDASRAAAAEGIACSYINQSSQERIVISVAKPGKTALAEIRTELASATPVDNYGAEGWFAPGKASVISGENWLVATSDYFITAADAQQLVTAALGHLK